MAKKLDPIILQILQTYEIEPKDALWDCHGSWIMLHKYVEVIAAKAGVTFERPEIIEHDTAAGIVALLCVGKLGDRQEWSVGECSPKNNKNAYPYAMAEKRAKDRVVLKLIGLGTMVYSEEEADDFKKNRPAPKPKGNPKTEEERKTFKILCETLRAFGDRNHKELTEWMGTDDVKAGVASLPEDWANDFRAICREALADAKQREAS